MTPTARTGLQGCVQVLTGMGSPRGSHCSTARCSRVSTIAWNALTDCAGSSDWQNCSSATHSLGCLRTSQGPMSAPCSHTNTHTYTQACQNLLVNTQQPRLLYLNLWNQQALQHGIKHQPLRAWATMAVASQSTSWRARGIGWRGSKSERRKAMWVSGKKPIECWGRCCIGAPTLQHVSPA